MPHDDHDDDHYDDDERDSGRWVEGDGNGHADASYGAGCREGGSHRQCSFSLTRMCWTRPVADTGNAVSRLDPSQGFRQDQKCQ